jgi:hypothetical protein
MGQMGAEGAPEAEVAGIRAVGGGRRVRVDAKRYAGCLADGNGGNLRVHSVAFGVNAKNCKKII